MRSCWWQKGLFKCGMKKDYEIDENNEKDEIVSFVSLFSFFRNPSSIRNVNSNEIRRHLCRECRANCSGCGFSNRRCTRRPSNRRCHISDERYYQPVDLYCPDRHAWELAALGS